MGKDSELNAVVHSLVKRLIAKCLELGGAMVGKIRFQWMEAENEARLEYHNTQRTALEDAKDEMIPLIEY